MTDDCKTERQNEAELIDLRQRLAAAKRHIAELEAQVHVDRPVADLETRRQFEMIADTLPALLAYVDTEQHYVYVNRLYADWYGLDQQEIIGRHIGDVLQEETYRRALPSIEAVLRGQSVTYENIAYDVQGQPHTVRASHVPHLDENGRVKAFLAMVEDITERKQAEKALRESERILNATGKMGKIGGWEHDLTTGKAVWTEALYDIIEIPYDQEPPGVDDHLSYYPPHDREVLDRAYNRAVEEGIPFDLELQVYTAKEKLIWCRAQGEPVFRDDECVTMRGTFQDITERKQVEHALLRRTRSLALINQSNREFGSTLDPHQVLTTVLEQARHLWDIAASSIWLIDPETQELVCHQATGPRYESVVGWRLAPGEGIAGWVANYGKSLIVPDAEKDDRHSTDVDQSIGLTVRSILSVPLRAKQSVIGVLQMLDVEIGRFDETDLQLLEPLAASAANAIANARLYQQAQQEIKERRQAEEQLHQSEAALKRAQRVAHVGSWTWHIQSNRLEWSDEMYRIFGVEKETFSGELSDVIERAIHPDDRAAVERSNMSVINDKKPIPLECRVVWPDGTIRTVWAEAGELILDEAGDPAILTGVVQDITERKRAEMALQQHVERLHTMRAIDGIILAAWTAPDTARAVLRHIRQLIPCQWAAVMTIDADAEAATLLALSSDLDTPLAVDARIPLEDAAPLADLQDGKLHLVQDMAALAQPSKMERQLHAAGVRSYLAVPLIAHGMLVGSLNLGATASAGFTAEHVDIASELAGQLAIAIRQARLFKQVQRHAEELEQQVAARTAELERRNVHLQAAAEVARDATTSHDLDQLLNRSVNLVRDRFGFYHAGIFLTDEAGADAVLRSATGEAGRQMLAQGHRLAVGQAGIVGHVCASGEPRIALDVGSDAAHFDNPCLPDTRSEMALPLQVQGRVIGALDVQSTEEDAFTEQDIKTLQIVADQLAVAIERTRLFEQTQAALEERLRAVISNAPVILFALDRDGTFTLLEGRGLEALALAPGEHVGLSVFDVYREFPTFLANARRALAGETLNPTLELEGTILETWLSPVRGEDGAVTGVIGVAVDVTQRERLQEQIRRQERLAAVGQLAGGIAHDFNNFLMTIIFYAHILLRGGDTAPDTTSIAETIVGEANRAADLVQQVLDFSRRSVMETQPVDLSSFVVEVVDILGKTLPENIQVMTEIEEGGHVVQIDPTRIQQVIMNLALNARDAMPQGGELHIALSRVAISSSERKPAEIADRELAAGEWVCLSVRDTGTGMDEGVQAHLFEPFFTTKGPKGNGLGLAQVYGIVKQHGGEIGVQTEVGQGTTFEIYLPVHTTDHAPVEGSEETKDIPRSRGETVLLVEDEARVRDAVQRVLQSLGYHILTAENGLQGLEVFEAAGEVDLVLTDMVMPEMGGRELLQQLKRVDPQIKALVITGYTMQEDVQALKDKGFADVVYKPLSVDVLGRTIRRILDSE